MGPSPSPLSQTCFVLVLKSATGNAFLFPLGELGCRAVPPAGCSRSLCNVFCVTSPVCPKLSEQLPAEKTNSWPVRPGGLQGLPQPSPSQPGLSQAPGTALYPCRHLDSVHRQHRASTPIYGAFFLFLF